MSLRHRLFQDPYYRFQSVAELRAAAALGIKLDVNRACVDDWLRLPGLSIHQARTLVALSQSGVQFHCLEDVAAALGQPVQRLQPLAPILQFCYYDDDSLDVIQPINPNRASQQQLMQIPGMNAGLVQNLLWERQQRGAYRNLVDLQQRLRLPGALITELMHYLRFD
ncbi:ComEA family DNA-binding protein [Leptolyngbya sp. NK1-12]|uniref:ComEA family DNA-binding protein n=1 Tax=Leptolyngbya sp. NK1-12 TaxID=2547451 RepID=A0AA96WDN6_9CYAN|nr:ComEA family DNA-binding protein [Leptolyngbya sp. NK1-12]WNZ23203.1 ComEA family DNA-binding protein [Leptolyngbya sp. NK1-12]